MMKKSIFRSIHIILLCTGCTQILHRNSPVQDIVHCLTEAESLEQQGNNKKADLFRKKAVAKAWETKDYRTIGLTYLTMGVSADDKMKSGDYYEKGYDFLAYAQKKSVGEISFREDLLHFLRQNFSLFHAKYPTAYQSLETRVREIK